MIVFDKSCQGDGEATAAIANALPLDLDAFDDYVRGLTNALGTTSIDCPKYLVVISDSLNQSQVNCIEKFKHRIKNLQYPVEFIVIKEIDRIYDVLKGLE